MPLTSGTFIGPYEVLTPLGAGGMGEVYRARDGRLGRDVALKVLSTDLAASGDHLRRFEQEARAASALNHPNIITIYEIGRLDSLAYIAMELIEGRDLRSLLAGEQLAPKQAVRIAVKVADGLSAAHERGIVHRDLKPENIMVSRDGYVKILDFGLAKLVRPFTETDTTVPHTTPGAVFGTVGYMSPEQAAGRSVDYHSDQFALGVILYEMLTGRMPFHAPTAAETLAAIIRTDPKPIALYNEHAPRELVRIVDRLLAKEPEERYTATRDLARDLREVRDRITGGAEPLPSTPPRPNKSRATWTAGIGLVILLAVLGAGVFMRNRTPPATSSKELRRVAVIPFADRTGSPDGAVFVAGLSEMIGARILQSDQIEVIPALDPAGAGPAAVARKRDASVAVHGSIQRSGDQLRVHFGVTEASSGRQVAANTITGSTDELFRLQDAVVEAILTALDARSTASLDERSVPTELTAAADQNAYIEALGLLQRSADRESVDRAITILSGLLKVARDSAPLNAQLARALVNKSQLTRTPALVEQAMIYAERAAEIDGSLPESHIRLGQTRVAAGKYADAAKSFERALVLRRDNADAVLGLGTAYEGLGRGSEAEKMYRRAIALRPDHANTFNRYAGFLYWAGRYDEAAANFARFNELLPTARGFSNLGETYMALGRYDDAEKACSRSVTIEPTTDAYICLGSVRFHTGRYSEACSAFEKATALAPDWYVGWASLGDACRWSPDQRERAGRVYEQAIVSAQKALGINPKDALAHALAASAMAKLGRHDRATESMNTALKMNPTSPDVLHAAAVVAQLKGNPEAAIHWIERAVDAGYSIPNLERDPEFRALHQGPAFREALKKRTIK